MVAVLFVVLRQLERWLHQHIFKVGWLVTKDYQTTTILYYTFLLPGVVLHEVIVWLMAGLLNVRADRQIQWPEAQQIGRLEHTFVKLPKNTHPLKLAVIHAIPLVIAVVIIWLISNNIFDVQSILTTIAPGTLDSVVAGVRQLFGVADFWLWFYLSFAIANTMLPDLKYFGGVRGVGTVAGVATVALAVIGVGDEIAVNVLGGPVASIMNVLSSTFAIVIAINLFMIGILAAIENTIEIITGDSADFRDGKMITMTREERLSQRMKEIERQRKARERKRAEEKVPIGPPTIYKLPLPIPGGPGDERVTPLQQVLPDGDDQAPPSLERPERAGAAVIPGELQGDETRRLGARPSRMGLPAGTGDAGVGDADADNSDADADVNAGDSGEDDVDDN